MWRFIKTALWGGVLFLIPATILRILFSVVYESYDFVRASMAPLAALSPIQAIGGVGVAALVAVAVIFSLCYLLGLVIRTAWAQRILVRCDSFCLGRVPFYAFLRSMLFEMSGRLDEASLDYALAWIEECWQPAVVMEELENGWLAVFVPRVPTPFSGALFYLPPDRVKKIETTSSAAVTVMARFGAGSRAMLKGQL